VRRHGAFDVSGVRIGEEQRRDRSGLFCKPGKVAEKHRGIERLWNIEVVLQTALGQGFSEAGLVAIASGSVGMGRAPCFPVAGMLVVPVALIGAYDIDIVAAPALERERTLLASAILPSAGDLPVAEAGMRSERRTAKRTAFFFGSCSQGIRDSDIGKRMMEAFRGAGISP
jgi:hypothetical protein